MAYLMDTRVLEKKMVDNVPIVRDFTDVFHEDLWGVLPERKV